MTLLTAVSFLALLAAGCSSSSSGGDTPGTGTGGSGGAGGSSGAAGAAGDSAQTVTITGTFKNAIGNGALAGVKICVVDPAGIPCVMTADDGTYAVPNLPKQTKVLVTVEKDTFFPAMGGFFLAGDETVNAWLYDKQFIVDEMMKAGVTYDPSLGAIATTVTDAATNMTGMAGVSFSLSPAGGSGPYYTDGLTVSSTITQTQKGGGASFVNLPLQSYQLMVTGASNCNAGIQWPGSGGAAMEVPTRAGFVTYAYPTCSVL